MSGLVGWAIFAIISGILGVLGLRSSGGRRHRISEVERQRREIRAILRGSDETRKPNPSPPSFVADRTVRFACAECGELTPSTEIEEVKGRKLCAACREALVEDDTLKTYRE